MRAANPPGDFSTSRCYLLGFSSGSRMARGFEMTMRFGRTRGDAGRGASRPSQHPLSLKKCLSFRMEVFRNAKHRNEESLGVLHRPLLKYSFWFCLKHVVP